MDNLFTHQDAWSGGFYELAFKLPQTTQSFVNQVLETLWSLPMLEGCFLKRDIEPSSQEKLSPLMVENEGHWYGIAHFPNGKQSCCGSICADYEDDGYWITLYTPLGSLARVYEIGPYPFEVEGHSHEQWIIKVNDWFREIAASILPTAKFELAIIGFEVDFFDMETKLEKGVPTERWEGILIPKENELLWYPPTIYDPPIDMG